MATTPAPNKPPMPGNKPPAPLTAQPIQAQPIEARPVDAQPVAAQPVPANPVSHHPQAAPGGPAPGGPAEDPEQHEESGGGSRFLLFNAVPSWLVSMVVHVILIIVLALVTFSTGTHKELINMVAKPEKEEVEEVEEFTIDEVKPVDLATFEAAATEVSSVTVEQMPTEVEDFEFEDDIEAAPIEIEFSDFGERTAPKSDLMAEIGTLEGTGVSGRGASRNGDLSKIKAAGGSEGSERAVVLALEWFARHQNPADGGWSFDHRVGYCNGQCSHPGSAATARNGATGLALMPFLGAGQTRQEGKYKKVVEAGLGYLMRNQKPEGGGGSFHESGGSMYSHGIAAIVLCEAYAMTHDKRLLPHAQAALNFIVSAQDPVGGGWRYQPRQAGDTSVVGWQLMALKSGHMGYLQVPPNVIRGAMKYLDSVQSDSGSAYGYSTPGRGTATSAIGLLCRMYLGWDKTEPALERGVQRLDTQGPSIAPDGKRAAMYYNYYATQIMRHWGGPEWEKWNGVMRDGLVKSQAQDGHMKGSWHFTGDHGAERGGRVYCTSMATMVLEVYYRHMPIYQKAAAKEDFPLE